MKSWNVIFSCPTCCLPPFIHMVVGIAFTQMFAVRNPNWLHYTDWLTTVFVLSLLQRRRDAQLYLLKSFQWASSKRNTNLDLALTWNADNWVGAEVNWGNYPIVYHDFTIKKDKHFIIKQSSKWEKWLQSVNLACYDSCQKNIYYPPIQT